MADRTKIEWTDHTFNPWWGCSRVSPACRFCYAERDAQRFGFQIWRRHGERRMLSEANWQRPLKWNRDAERAGVPAKVFCASMADVFEEHPQVADARKRLWDVMEATPWLRWQLLTKRPENVAGMVRWGEDWPPWVWLGTSVENQRYASQRIPVLLAVRAKTHFLSCEPLLGPVSLVHWLPRIDWVIIGGESGSKARPMDLGWVRALITQCRDTGTAVFVKQLGSAWAHRHDPLNRHGGGPEAWPEDLRIRDFPRS